MDTTQSSHFSSQHAQKITPHTSLTPPSYNTSSLLPPQHTIPDLPTTPIPAIPHRSEGGWKQAFKQASFVYIITHIIYIVVTYLAILFSLKNFSNTVAPDSLLLQDWNRWDTSQFTRIAVEGYTGSWQCAFFPLYPLLEHGLSYLVKDPYIAGLLIANLAGFGVLLLLYTLVEQDFKQEHATRTIFSLSLSRGILSGRCLQRVTLLAMHPCKLLFLPPRQLVAGGLMRTFCKLDTFSRHSTTCSFLL
ncbi:hypothetical protein [Tengunoibacter tsumagoiensis]|uniref:hypothetical protein n=1 Tax=Tengunoibacter tsumagoiensis TaxID=2014871 RepID=UPI000F84BF9B|nr:hypothetical protein [Tengunoibacter tsumagoiensis]